MTGSFKGQQISMMGHVVVGYPTLDVARTMIDIMVDAGVKFFEVQIPFSEPIADGPHFVRANHQSIESGTSVSDAFDFMADVTANYGASFYFMTYANIPYRMGFSEFVIQAKKAGAHGAIIPDLPYDYAEEYLRACRLHEFHAVQVLTPNVVDVRMRSICKVSTGFVYAAGRTGVTGSKTEISNFNFAFFEKIKSQTDIPLAVGFGIQEPEQVKSLKDKVDIAVVGTHSLRVYEREGWDGFKSFWKSMVESTDD